MAYGESNSQEPVYDTQGTQIGNYRIEEKIGSGGAADVHLAVRTDDVHHQPVALKIIKGWGHTHELAERMKRERRILSQLRHPNIASFLDGGNAKDGRPYYVLEYIKGESITDYCNNHKLSLKDRLILFRKVCDAVSAAHSQLILHRDLKPSNILVTEDGSPKLLDFGIAKLLDDSDNQAQLTQFFAPMTPQYASPEQIKQEPLSVASDQYSLGILLYQLITGELPYDTKESSMAHITGNLTLKRPSHGVANNKNHNDNEKRRLIKQLKGDLDAIVMKAIHKEADYRYPSVKELSEDIRRYLENKPVHAQKRSYWYQTRRFLQRNLATVAISLIFACATTFIGITQQMRIIEERDQAILEREKFKQTQYFLLSLFKFSHPEKNYGDELTVKQVLDRGADSIKNQFNDQPSVKVTLMTTLAKAYKKLQLPEKAIELYTASFELQKAIESTPNEMMATTLSNIAELLTLRGENKKANNYLNQAIAIYQELDEKDPKNEADAYSAAGILANRLGKYKESKQFLSHSLSIREAHFEQNHREIIKSHMELGVVYTAEGNYEQAQYYNEQALILAKQNPKENYTTLSSVHNTIAVTYHLQGNLQKAEEHYQESIKIRTNLFGENNIKLVTSYNNLGEVHTALNNFDKAIQYHEKSLAILEKNNNKERYLLAVTHNRLGDALIGKHHFDSAHHHLQLSLDIRKEIYGDQHHDLAKSYHSFGDLYSAMDSRDKAKESYEKALSIRLRAYGEEHALTKETLKAINSLKLNALKYEQTNSY
nr:serine/threonine-protein kinase [Marinibactrum halimedae]